ncbi:MAG TPA: hypothetical protein VKA28_02710 [Candidatus Bathyarchaeia archaeon]|nr:hypothetical protein [Candidatus Bathyarchaeia archaeon]
MILGVAGSYWQLLLRLDPRRMLILSFVVLSVGSAIYISAAAVNYLLLNPALDQIQNEQSFQVDRLSLVQSLGSNMSSLEVQITVRNPSGYSGLRLFGVTVGRIIFYSPSNNNMSVLPGSSSPNASEMVGKPLGPNSAVSVNIVIPLTSNQTSLLVSAGSTNSVMGLVDLRVDIATFLESVTGTQTYTRMQDVPLSYK